MERRTYKQFKEEYDKLLSDFVISVTNSIVLDSRTTASVLHRGHLYECSIVSIPTVNVTLDTEVEVRRDWVGDVIKVKASRVYVVAETLNEYVRHI